MPSKLLPGKCVSMLVYGVPGVGKTRLVGSGPATLIIRPPTDHTDSITQPADVEEQIVSNWEEMFDIHRDLQQGLAEQYEWVWLDSITLFEDFGLDDVFAAAVARKESRKEFGPDQGEYGINRGRLMKWLRDMYGLSSSGKFNLGVTAHPMEWWDPVKEQQVWTPMVGSPQKGNLSVKVCGYMNIVAYLDEQHSENGSRSRRVLLADAPGFVGKDQFDCFPELKSGRHGFIEPTMEKIISAINTRRKPPKAARRKTTATRRRRPK